jgi:hypothetical protein
MAEYTIKIQDDVARDMLADAADGENRRARVRGLLTPSKGLGPTILNFVHPLRRDEISPLHRRALRTWTRGAKWVDRALA